MKNYRKFLTILLCTALAACQPADSPGEVEAPLGRIVASIGGSPFVFADASGIGEIDAQGYTSATRFVSIYRQVTAQDRRSLQLRLFNLDIDQLAVPAQLASGAQVSLFLGGGGTYTATNTDISVRIVGKSGDVLQGTFSATLRNTLNSADVLRLTNGSFHIALKRF